MTHRFLGGHFEEEVEAEKEEDDVGRPAGQERRELADTAHGAEKFGAQPVHDADRNADRAQPRAVPSGPSRQQAADGLSLGRRPDGPATENEPA